MILASGSCFGTLFFCFVVLSNLTLRLVLVGVVGVVAAVPVVTLEESLSTARRS